MLDSNDRSRFARDVYTYAHAPIVGGVILAAAALEEITLHPSDPVPTSFKMMLWGGLSLYLIGVVVGAWRAYGIIARERLLAIVVIGGLGSLAASVSGVVLVIALDAALLVMLVIEHLRIEAPSEGTEAAVAAG